MPLPLAAIPAIASVASEIIPSIAGWFGGDDAKDTAEKFVGYAKKVTGMDDGKSAMDQLRNDPAAALEVERMMHEWRVKQLEAAVALYKTDAEDRANARAHEDSHKGTTKWLAFIIMTAFVAVTFWIVWKGLPVDDAGEPIAAATVGAVIGMLSMKAEQVTSYFFGSSSGSMIKTLTGGGKAK